MKTTSDTSRSRSLPSSVPERQCGNRIETHQRPVDFGRAFSTSSRRIPTAKRVAQPSQQGHADFNIAVSLPVRVECHPLSETCAVPCTYDEQARLGNSERVPPVCRYYLYALLSEGWSRIRSSRCYSATPEAVSSRRRPPDDYRASGASARNPVWTQSSSSAAEHLGLGGARRGWAGRMRSYHILRHRRCRRSCRSAAPIRQA